MNITSTANLRTVVRQAFEDELGRTLLSEEWDEPARTLGLDSLEEISVVCNVEKSLGIRIPDDIADGLNSPNKVLKYLESL